MAIIGFLDSWRMSEPNVFGSYHFFFLFFAFLFATYLVCYFRDSSVRTMKRIVLVFWIVMMVLEIGKQFVLSYHGGVLEYSWGGFPFQFCEVQLFVIPILLINKNKRVQDALISFLSTYSFFAGFTLIIYPISLLGDNVFLVFRQMLDHSFQATLGIFLFAWNRKNSNLLTFWFGSIVFLISVASAITINTIVEDVMGHEINMFYLSPHHDSVILIVKDIQPHVPWIVFVASYIIGFGACALGSHLAMSFIYSKLAKWFPSIEKDEFERIA